MATTKKEKWTIVLATLVALCTAAVTMYLYKRSIRQHLFAELKPVQLKNCNMKRFGNENDGGFLLCENLASGVDIAYSYGIGGRDSWGCDVSRKYDVAVNQYDCFELYRPMCEGGNFVFHEQCIGPIPEKVEGRFFDSFANQVKKNRDSDKSILLKMDVEGAEWESLLTTPDELLRKVNQIAIEFHRVDDPKYIKVIEKLNKNFYVADIHFNNYSCRSPLILSPFPAWAYEVLFVNKEVAEVDHSAPDRPIYSHPLHRKNNPIGEDCQYEP